jgi:hypothetical protein
MKPFLKRLSRRTVLRGAGGVVLSLPLLEAMAPRRAVAQTNAPRRIIFEFKPNGDQTSERFTSEDPTAFQFGEFLNPLEPYRDELLVMNMLDKRFFELPQSERADNHQQGGMALAPWPAGEGDYPVGGEDRTIGTVLGPSADYEIGERTLGQDSSLPYRHLVYRVGDRDNHIWNLSSHAGPIGQKNPVLPETNPQDAFARLFGGGDPEAEAVIQRRIQKKASVLDLLLEESLSLEQRLGASDRQKVEQFSDALRNIERSLAAEGQGGACGTGTIGEELEPYQDENHAGLGAQFQQLIALALSCDLTRTVNFNWHGNTSNRVYGDLGLGEGHHDISHQSTSEAFASVRAIHRHLWTLSTNLYEVLKSTPEGEGTLWDNTLIVHWNELGQGDSHSINDQLVVFAGGMDGYFRRGAYENFGNDMGFSEMLVSCFHYMGFEDVELFGDERLAAGGPIPGITA